MPLIQVDMFAGRTDEQVRRLVEELTAATCRALGCKAEDVSILVREVSPSRWATGGALWTDR
ncbi:MAG: tautomerase family protein [Proteobacteria bacterium]|nr:tautomerase family protein [Pseudomonadota bacterium]